MDQADDHETFSKGYNLRLNRAVTPSYHNLRQEILDTNEVLITQSAQDIVRGSSKVLGNGLQAVSESRWAAVLTVCYTCSGG